MLIKILEKQQKVKKFLEKFNNSKLNDIYKLRMTEREMKFRQHTIDNTDININNVQKEYYTGKLTNTLSWKLESIFNDNTFENVVENMKSFSWAKKKTKEVNEILDKIRNKDIKIVQIKNDIDSISVHNQCTSLKHRTANLNCKTIKFYTFSIHHIKSWNRA